MLHLSFHMAQGDLRAYELWPHIFPLDGDHMSSTMQDPRRGGFNLSKCLLNLVVPEVGLTRVIQGYSIYEQWNI